MGFGWCLGSKNFKIDGDEGFKYDANEFRATGFWEWAGGDALLRWHVGPGGSLGLYNYTYYHEKTLLYSETALGIEAGAQVGGEIRWRKLTVSADVRPTFYYTGFQDTDKNAASGITFTIGAGIGYVF